MKVSKVRFLTIFLPFFITLTACSTPTQNSNTDTNSNDYDVAIEQAQTETQTSASQGTDPVTERDRINNADNELSVSNETFQYENFPPLPKEVTERTRKGWKNMIKWMSDHKSELASLSLRIGRYQKETEYKKFGIADDNYLLHIATCKYMPVYVIDSRTFVLLKDGTLLDMNTNIHKDRSQWLLFMHYDFNANTLLDKGDASYVRVAPINNDDAGFADAGCAFDGVY